MTAELFTTEQSTPLQMGPAGLADHLGSQGAQTNGTLDAASHGARDESANPVSPPACDECDKAAKRLHHGFAMGCMGCCARAAARSPQARRARDNGDRFDPEYRRLLDQFGLTHNQVLTAARADKLGGINPKTKR